MSAETDSKTSRGSGPQISLKAINWLNVFMFANIALSVLDYLVFPPSVQHALRKRVKDAPFMADWPREPGGTAPLAEHFKEAPFLYGVLHILPGALWTLLIPFQQSASLRRSRPTLHHVFGYTIFFSTLLFNLSAIALLQKKLVYTHDDVWHIHRPYPDVLPFLGWPTMGVWGPLVALLQTVVACLTIAAARRRDIPTHQKWATVHTILGLVMAWERVLFYLFMLFGNVLAAVPMTWQKWLRVPMDIRGRAEGELGVFALTAWGGLAISVWWTKSVLASAQTSQSLKTS